MSRIRWEQLAVQLAAALVLVVEVVDIVAVVVDTADTVVVAVLLQASLALQLRASFKELVSFWRQRNSDLAVYLRSRCWLN